MFDIKKRNLVIFDYSQKYKIDNRSNSWCWDQSTEDYNSIIDYIENNHNYFKKKYLDYIYDITTRKIADISLEDHLRINDDFSFWRMSSIVEQHVNKTPILDILKTFALSDMILEINPKYVEYHGNCRKLKKTLKRFCSDNNISFKSDNTFKIISLISFKCTLLYQIKSIVYLISYIYKRFTFIKNNPFFCSDESTITFFGFFFNIKESQTIKQNYISPYWGSLKSTLVKLGIFSNSVNHFIEYDGGKSARGVQDLITCFNQVPEKEGYHSIFNNYLTFRSFFKIIYLWIILQIKILRIKNKPNIFISEDCPIDLWYFFYDNWMDSFHGSHSIGSLVAKEQCDLAMKILPKQKAGFYICENQNWEKALIYAWNKYDHGKLYGVPHSTIRFWDLRYSVDKRFMTEQAHVSKYFPYKYIMNGDAAYYEFLNGGFPKEMLEKAEALRYEYLLNKSNLNLERKLHYKSNKILILGDYIKDETITLLNLLTHCPFTRESEIDFVFKPHPKSPIDLNMFPQLKITVENRSFDQLPVDFNICISTNMTSAAVDAYLIGCNVMIMHALNNLNLSCLRGFADVQFFRNTEELNNLLSNTKNYKFIKSNRKRFFYLNREHLMWKEILNKNV